HTARRYPIRDEFYRRYLNIIEHAKGQIGWGTYFQRLIAFGTSNRNQLEESIIKLSSWQTEQVAAHYFHLSSREIDSPRKMGGPCWQYAQLKVKDGKITMTAVYRNHDFFEKAFGNYIALGQLLQFISSEADLEPGLLICHSIHAFCKNANHLERLIEIA
ncbi:MAG: hypothetical protein ACRDF4_00240, partial [Rhabdochlamydiaceae bacterium]